MTYKDANLRFHIFGWAFFVMAGAAYVAASKQDFVFEALFVIMTGIFWGIAYKYIKLREDLEAQDGRS